MKLASLALATLVSLATKTAGAADYSPIEAVLRASESQASIWRAERFPRKSPKGMTLAVARAVGPNAGDTAAGRTLVIARGEGRWEKECPSCSSSGTVKTLGVYSERDGTFSALYMERDDCPLEAAFLRARRGAPDLVEVDRVECDDFGKPRYLEYYALSSTGVYHREIQVPLQERVTADGPDGSLDYTDTARFEWTTPDSVGDRTLVIDARRRVDYIDGDSRQPKVIRRVYRWTGNGWHLSEQTEDGAVVLDRAAGLRLQAVEVLQQLPVSHSGPKLVARFDDPNERVRRAVRIGIFGQLYVLQKAGRPIAHAVFPFLFARLQGADEARAREALMTLRSLNIYPIYGPAEREALLAYSQRKNGDWDALFLLARQRVPEVLPIARKQLERALDSSDGCAAERSASLLYPYLDDPQSWMPGLLNRAKSSTLICDDGTHGPNPISHSFDGLLKRISK